MEEQGRKPDPTEPTPQGFEVRIPKRRQFFENLKKIAKADRADKAHSASRSPKR